LKPTDVEENGFAMNIQKLMKQAQQMQEKLQQELGELVVDASVGGGMVEVKMNGHKQLVSVAIDPEVLDPEDPGMLQDLVLAAVNGGPRDAPRPGAGRGQRGRPTGRRGNAEEDGRSHGRFTGSLLTRGAPL
jgi:DNA-binding YbaB/EbfC family protein